MSNHDNKKEKEVVDLASDESVKEPFQVPSWITDFKSESYNNIDLGEYNKFRKDEPENINEKIDEEERKKKIENDSRQQDIELKKQTLEKLFKFLHWETVAIFGIAFLQGFKIWRFNLDNISFDILTTVTILQITTMLLIAVKHLFPNKE